MEACGEKISGVVVYFPSQRQERFEIRVAGAQLGNTRLCFFVPSGARKLAHSV
jgi:hypothetical protein